MNAILVVERPELWSFLQAGEPPLAVTPLAVEVVAARAYLTDPVWLGRRRLRVFNLCRSYRYQSLGYYVSLLAEARGHRPLPKIETIQDLKSQSLVRMLSDDLDRQIQQSLRSIRSEEFTLSIYFGQNLAERHNRLARALFNLFPAPLLRAELRFKDSAAGKRWQVEGLRPISSNEVPESHRAFVATAAHEYFARPLRKTPRRKTRWHLAILVDPEDPPTAPSNEKALRRFERAAWKCDMRPERITRDDFGHLGEYDALFVRELTAVNHYTYRFVRRAAAEGLALIDDPGSMVRCTNKVFLAELLERADIPMPKTAIVHRDNLEEAIKKVGLPAVLKLPDGSFSTAVKKVLDRESFLRQARAFLEESDLVIAQEFLRTEYDWRIGVVDRQVLYAARYHMVSGHWQIAQHDQEKGTSYGGVQAVAVEHVPSVVLETALAAANRIGDGLYGVDLKERDGRAWVIEVNDNPNIEAGYEDGVIGDELYLRIMQVFARRIEKLEEKKS